MEGIPSVVFRWPELIEKYFKEAHVWYYRQKYPVIKIMKRIFGISLKKNYS